MSLKHSVKFVLAQKSEKSKLTVIRVYVRFNSGRSIFNSGVRVEPRHFNPNTQEARVTSMFDGSEINKRLSDITDFVKRKFEGYFDFPDHKEFEALCKEFVKSGYRKEADPISSPVAYDLIGFIDKLKTDSENGVRLLTKGPRKGQRYMPDTLKAYSNTVMILRKYADHLRVTGFGFDEINLEWYDRFSEFFYTTLGNTVAYFGLVIRVIKTAMEEARELGLHTNDAYKSRRFIKPSYESDTVYLTIEQLKTLQEFDFKPSQQYLDNARDLFLVGCWTGLRFSDFSTLRPEDLQDGYIRIKAQKTSERIAIPFHPMLRKIIEKNGGGLPRAISNQKLNDYIKDAVKEAGITYPVKVRKNIAGKDEYQTFTFDRLVTTHAARRSFATNMFKKGIPPLLIMAITGHRTEAAFLRYIRVSNEEKAQLMAELWKAIKWD